MVDYNDPFFKRTDEERRNMTQEEYCALIGESNEYVRKKHRKPNEREMPTFNTIEELRAYYHCMPLEEAFNKLNQLFDTNGRVPKLGNNIGVADGTR